jgi:hypothetical protein
MSSIEWNEKTFSKFAYLGDPRIRGSKVAYVLTKANMKDNKYESTVVVEDLETGARRFVENASMPRISPDGKSSPSCAPTRRKRRARYGLPIWKP